MELKIKTIIDNTIYGSMIIVSAFTALAIAILFTQGTVAALATFFWLFVFFAFHTLYRVFDLAVLIDYRKLKK